MCYSTAQVSSSVGVLLLFATSFMFWSFRRKTISTVQPNSSVTLSRRHPIQAYSALPPPDSSPRHSSLLDSSPAAAAQLSPCRRRGCQRARRASSGCERRRPGTSESSSLMTSTTSGSARTTPMRRPRVTPG